jgi:hypothetical protein
MNTPTKCKGRIRRNRIDLGPCNFKEWKDGYCKIHHPDEKKRKNSDRIKVKENLYQQGMKNKKEAMYKHAKSVAIMFAEWIGENKYHSYFEGKWKRGITEGEFTTDELFKKSGL